MRRLWDLEVMPSKRPLEPPPKVQLAWDDFNNQESRENYPPAEDRKRKRDEAAEE